MQSLSLMVFMTSYMQSIIARAPPLSRPVGRHVSSLYSDSMYVESTIGLTIDHYLMFAPLYANHYVISILLEHYPYTLFTS